jgi:hypothetical protein
MKGVWQRKIMKLVAVVVGTGALTIASPARAEGSPYCEKVRARASADASLLFAPSLQVQGVRYPKNGAIDTSATVGQGYQVRTAVSWSPLDFYKGFRVLEVGQADCEQHEAMITAQQVLTLGVDAARLPALRKTREFLAGQNPRWDAIVQKNDERLAEHVTSLLDANEVRARGGELDKKRAAMEGDVARLEAIGIDAYRGMLSSLMTSIESKAMTFERKASHVRSLEPWTFSITGGVVPQEKPVDYFGVVQVGFNVGAFSRNSADARYLDARAEELRKARYELIDQLRRFKTQVHITNAQSKRELEIVDRRLGALNEARKLLATSEAPNAPHALAILDLDTILAEADRVFLTALVAELSKMEENGNAG